MIRGSGSVPRPRGDLATAVRICPGLSSSRDDADRMREDLEAGRVPADELPVEIDHLVPRVDRQLLRPEMLDVRTVEVRAFSERREVPPNGPEVHVADDDDVEEAVLEVRVGRGHESAAEEAAVRDDDIVHDALPPRLRVRLEGNAGVPVSRQGAEDRDKEAHAAAEDLRRAVHAVDDGASGAELRDVDEVPHPLPA